MSARSIVYGSAFPDDSPVKDSERVRVYIVDGAQFIGHETFDVSHVCSEACATRVLATRDDSAWIGTEEGWKRTDNGTSSYVSLSRTRSGNIITADVQCADFGDDPYVKCSACGEELHRDDALYEAQYGRKLSEVLGETTEEEDEA